MNPEIFINVVVLLLPIMFTEMTPEVRLPQMQQQSVVIHKPVVAELTLRMTTVWFVVRITFFTMLNKFFLRVRLQLVWEDVWKWKYV